MLSMGRRNPSQLPEYWLQFQVKKPPKTLKYPKEWPRHPSFWDHGHFWGVQRRSRHVSAVHRRKMTGAFQIFSSQISWAQQFVKPSSHFIPPPTLPYPTILYSTRLHSTLLYSTILYHTILCYTIPYYTAPSQNKVYICFNEASFGPCFWIGGGI